jgi:hypothetical protein
MGVKITTPTITDDVTAIVLRNSGRNEILKGKGAQRCGRAPAFSFFSQDH